MLAPLPSTCVCRSGRLVALNYSLAGVCLNSFTLTPYQHHNVLSSNIHTQHRVCRSGRPQWTAGATSCSLLSPQSPAWLPSALDCHPTPLLTACLVGRTCWRQRGATCTSTGRLGLCSLASTTTSTSSRCVSVILVLFFWRFKHVLRLCLCDVVVRTCFHYDLNFITVRQCVILALFFGGFRVMLEHVVFVFVWGPPHRFLLISFFKPPLLPDDTPRVLVPWRTHANTLTPQQRTYSTDPRQEPLPWASCVAGRRHTRSRVHPSRLPAVPGALMLCSCVCAAVFTFMFSCVHLCHVACSGHARCAHTFSTFSTVQTACLLCHVLAANANTCTLPTLVCAHTQTYNKTGRQAAGVADGWQGQGRDA